MAVSTYIRFLESNSDYIILLVSIRLVIGMTKLRMAKRNRIKQKELSNAK